MPTVLNKIKSAVVFSAFSLLLLMPIEKTRAALPLTEVPLFLSSGAESNVMFVLDDSGSMMFEVMPESLILGSARYVFPRADGVYGGGDYTNRAPKPGQLYGKILRSKNNTIYYDPSVLYKPWALPEGPVGTLMPNANPSCAWHNPRRTNSGSEAYCRKLTADNSRTFSGLTANWITCTDSATCALDSTDLNYWPATYYYFSGTSSEVWTDSKYTLREIKSTTPTYTGDGRGVNRTDCTVVAGAATCTYAQEIQNFANWYTYYRSRMLLARAGAGKAFSEQGETLRVGFGTINKGSTDIDNVNTSVIINGVRKFTPAEKTEFLKTFYDRVVPNAGTPLRTALDSVGQYFSRSDNRGPWGDNPGSTTSGPHVACRTSNAILMTDGYWSDTFTLANQDGTAGTTLTNDEPGATPSSFTYAASNPFQDSLNDTLADVAMKYWKTDLRPTLANRIKVKVTPVADPNHANDSVDPAFWQHMTTYTVGLGVFGTLGISTPVPDLIKATSPPAIAWPDPSSGSEERKIDDLMHAAVNGHGNFFSAKNPDEFSDQLSAVLNEITGREKNNAAAAAANSTSLNEESIIFQALFDSKDWTGRVNALKLSSAGVVDSLNPLWTSSVPTSGRNIYTHNGSAGIELLWTNLTVAQKDALKGTVGDTSDTAGQARLDWIRGNDTSKPEYDIRSRGGKLVGDIVNSDPAYGGANNSRYYRLVPTTLGGSSYNAFYNGTKKTRRQVLYVGANDGLLHAFNAKNPVSGTGVSTLGQEIFGYVPTQVFSKLRELTSQSYAQTTTEPHRYFVDGPVHIGDAFFNNAWHSILVGTLGAGGRGIYVLDVTDPDTFSAAKVLFELTPDKYPQLGNVMGQAVIGAARDGRWKIFLGNGYNSGATVSPATDMASLGIIDIEDEVNGVLAATSKTRFLSTNNVTSNGLAQPALQVDPAGLIKAAYAGDLYGNLWKFDLSSATSSVWAISYAGPLFTAVNSNSPNNVQPITSSPNLGVNNATTPASVNVYFGTGRYLTQSDKNSSTDIQSYYAIADKGAKIITPNRGSLHQKTFSTTGNQRTIGGQTTGTAPNLVSAVNWATKDGWYIDFLPGERIITKALLAFDRLFFPTVIPTSDPCGFGGTGWLMELIGVGDGNLDFTLYEPTANTFLDIAIFGRLTKVQGVGKPTTATTGSAASTASGASSSKASCDGGTALNIAVGIDASGNTKAPPGKGPCGLIGRQSWRELR
jgi:type IV pilus assembly protein PilY1